MLKANTLSAAGVQPESRRALIGASIGHAVHDLWYGVAPILLASLSGSVSLSNSEIGLALLLYQALSSISQPFFGRWAEKSGGREIGVGAILWTTTTFTIALLAPGKVILIGAIALAGLGSGAWHPQGVVTAGSAGGARFGATATSIFFFGGTLGTAIVGSSLGGWLIGTYGKLSLLLFTAGCTVMALTLIRSWLPKTLPRSHHTEAAEGHTANGGSWVLVGIVLLATALRSFTSTSLTTYVPKMQEDLGTSAAAYGLLMGFYLVGNAVGGVVGSFFADRLGIRRVLVVSLGLGAAFLMGFFKSEGIWSYLFIGLAGFFLGPSHTLLLVSGQRLFPGRAATAVGFFLGFNFVSGAGGAWLLGLAADRYGLAGLLGWLPWAALGAGLLSLAIKVEKRKDPEPAN